MNSKIFKSSLQVVILMLIIKMLGLLKQSIIASICGASYETDLYFLSSGLITQLCTVIFSGISVTLLSIYVDAQHYCGKNKANSIIDSTLKSIMPVSILIGIVFLLFAKDISRVLAPSYNSVQIEDLANYIRLLSLLFIFISYYLIINVTLEAQTIMLPGKMISFLQNLFTILFVYLLYKKIGADCLIYALLFANLIACIYITIRAKKYYVLTLNSRFSFNEMRTLFALTVPLLIGNAMYEISDIVDKQIASSLGNGVVSYLSYGTSINEIINALIGSAVGSVLFVHYTSWATEKKYDDIANEVHKSMSLLTFILIPITIISIICRYDIVTILYGRGCFSEYDALQTGNVLLGYSVGFIFQAGRSNLVKVYYALKNTRIPMINGILCIGINISCSIYLSKFLGISGVSLGTSISMVFAFILLAIGLKHVLRQYDVKKRIKNYLKMSFIFVVSFICTNYLHTLLNITGVFRLIVITVFSIIIYCVLGFVLKEEISVEFIEKIKLRSGKNNA